jgi:hypothetical protein
MAAVPGSKKTVNEGSGKLACLSLACLNVNANALVPADMNTAVAQRSGEILDMTSIRWWRSSDNAWQRPFCQTHSTIFIARRYGGVGTLVTIELARLSLRPDDEYLPPIHFVSIHEAWATMMPRWIGSTALSNGLSA